MRMDFPLEHKLSVLVKTGVWVLCLDLCFWTAMVSIYLNINLVLFYPVFTEGWNSFILVHSILLWLKWLGMQPDVLSRPLDFNFTHSHRLQHIMLQLKEIMSENTIPRVVPGGMNECAPLMLAPSQEKKVFKWGDRMTNISMGKVITYFHRNKKPLGSQHRSGDWNWRKQNE